MWFTFGLPELFSFIIYFFFFVGLIPFKESPVDHGKLEIPVPPNYIFISPTEDNQPNLSIG